MTPTHVRPAEGRRSLVAALVGLAGATCLAVALSDQEQAPQPALSLGGAPVPAATAQDSDPGSAGMHPLGASAPRYLTIPAIGVRSPLLHLGLTAQGAMEVPGPGPHYDDAGWYRHSPTPGSRGPAVIVGHVDSAAKGPSVFFRLGGLRPKDSISVLRDDGSVAVFAVEAVQRFHKARFPSELVYGDTKNSALRLVTCGGTFDAATGRYLDNIVVTAALVSSTGA